MHISLLTEIFDDIILGRGVKRVVHDLQMDGQDYADLFIERLLIRNYRECEIKNVVVDVGIRYPAFYLMDGKAYFGHLFWEVFTSTRKRKIWGSIIRNDKGDWKYIIPGNSSKIIYVNTAKAQEVDIHYLT